MSAIIGLDGQPLGPANITQRLKQIDPALGLRYVHGMKQWAVTHKWSLTDSRRELIQRGDLNPEDDCDVIAWLPEDCSVDEAYGYIERQFVRMGPVKAEVAKMLERLDNFNDKQVDDVMQPVNDLAEELIETNAPTLFEGKHIPKSTKIGRHKSKKDEKLFEEFMRDR